MRARGQVGRGLTVVVGIVAAAACGSGRPTAGRETPAQVDRGAVAESAPPLPPAGTRPRIVVLGDSLTAGLGLAPDQLEKNLAAIIERANERGIVVVLAGMEAPPNWGPEYTKAFHRVYPTLAARYHAPLVPFLLAGVAGIARLNQQDGIHPTAEGDRIIADTVWAVLEPLARRGASSDIGADAHD
ncbi:MAG: GDSL-type esterase/lipase family protein [Acidobacteriota bacterium]